MYCMIISNYGIQLLCTNVVSDTESVTEVNEQASRFSDRDHQFAPGNGEALHHIQTGYIPN